MEQGVEADIAAEAQRLEDEKEKPEEVAENPSLHPIEETAEEEEEETEEPSVAPVEPPPRRRSYSPAEHNWGDDEEDDDPAVEVDIDEPALDEPSDTQKIEADEEEDDNDTIHDPVGSQSTATHVNGFLSSPGGEHRLEDPSAYDEDDFEEYSDRELDFSGDSEDSGECDWEAR